MLTDPLPAVRSFSLSLPDFFSFSLITSIYKKSGNGIEFENVGLVGLKEIVG